jgi:hypothetical protein
MILVPIVVMLTIIIIRVGNFVKRLPYGHYQYNNLVPHDPGSIGCHAHDYHHQGG